MTVVRVLGDGFGHAEVGILCHSFCLSCHALALLCALTSAFFYATRPFLCSPGAVYQHVQSDHIQTRSPSQEERSKFVHLQYSRDELLSDRPTRSTPDLAARFRPLDIGFCLPSRRTRRGEEGK